MLRYKRLIGQGLHARTPMGQKVEAEIACKIINRMPDLGMPVSRRIA